MAVLTVFRASRSRKKQQAAEKQRLTQIQSVLRLPSEMQAPQASSAMAVELGNWNVLDDDEADDDQIDDAGVLSVAGRALRLSGYSWTQHQCYLLENRQ